MTKIIDEDIIRQHPVSDAYRDGWERTFGDKDAPLEPSKDAMTVVLTQPIVNAVAWVPMPGDCDGYYVDFQGARRPCTRYEGCGCHNCLYVGE